MVSPVDFNKNVDCWQQDKWTGYFSVKRHIVKDVPNTIPKHIILANNENKPVTNSRDTQEVKLEQGLQIIKIFKNHVSKISILDDFGFYETRQKVMQEKRAKQQQLHKPVHVTKPLDIVDAKNKECETRKSNLLNSNETITIMKSNSIGLGDIKPNEENGLASTAENKAVLRMSFVGVVIYFVIKNTSCPGNCGRKRMWKVFEPLRCSSPLISSVENRICIKFSD